MVSQYARMKQILSSLSGSIQFQQYFLLFQHFTESKFIEINQYLAVLQILVFYYDLSFDLLFCVQ
jgi:hypothetical protein